MHKCADTDVVDVSLPAPADHDSRSAVLSGSPPSAAESDRTAPTTGGRGISARPRILFVDDEPLVLDGIARSLHRSAAAWQLELTHDPREALRLVERESYDVIVTDMQMPGMTGAQLLAQVAAIQPDCMRLMLTGQADIETAVAAVNEGHVFRLLFKPCPGELLRRNLEQALHLRRLQTAERDLLQERLEHAQRLAIVGEFTAGVVHDVNNMLSAVINLSRESDLFEPQRALRLINEAGHRAADLTRELMGFSRRDDGDESEPLELGPVVRGCTTLLRPMLANERLLELHLPEQEIWVLGHAGRLQQVISNLVINARDATPENGLIVIETKPDCAPADGPASTRFVRVTVRDNGSGMDDATRQRLFEPFFTTKAAGRGTGLGLALVQQLVRRLNGVIEVESTPGAGAAFHVFVPLAEAA